MMQDELFGFHVTGFTSATKNRATMFGDLRTSDIHVFLTPILSAK